MSEAEQQPNLDPNVVLLSALWEMLPPDIRESKWERMTPELRRDFIIVSDTTGRDADEPDYMSQARIEFSLPIPEITYSSGQEGLEDIKTEVDRNKFRQVTDETFLLLRQFNEQNNQNHRVNHQMVARIRNWAGNLFRKTNY